MIPLHYFIDRSNPYQPKGLLTSNGLTSAMFNPLYGNFTNQTVLDLRSRDSIFIASDYDRVEDLTQRYLLLADGNNPTNLHRVSGYGIQTISVATNAYLQDYININVEKSVRAGMGGFQVSPWNIKFKTFVMVAAIQIQALRTLPDNSGASSACMGIGGYDTFLRLDFERYLPGGTPVHRLTIRYDPAGHGVNGAYVFGDVPDQIQPTTLNKWLLVELVQWYVGATHYVTTRILGGQFNDGSGNAIEGITYSGSVGGWNPTNLFLPVNNHVPLAFCTAAIYNGNNDAGVAGTQMNDISWRIFDAEHTCASYSTMGNQIHFSCTGQVAWEILVNNQWQRFDNKFYSGENTINTPSFTAIRPVLKNSGVLNADTVSVLNWVDVATTVVPIITAGKSLLRRQLESYFANKGGSLPEWYIKELEEASSGDRIQMLRDRGIYELPEVVHD